MKRYRRGRHFVIFALVSHKNYPFGLLSLLSLQPIYIVLFPSI